MLKWIKATIRDLQTRLTIKRAELGVVSAIWNALIGADTAYFPRIVEEISPGESVERTMDAGAIMKEVNAKLATFNLNGLDKDHLGALRESYRESLDEVSECPPRYLRSHPSCQPETN